TIRNSSGPSHSATPPAQPILRLACGRAARNAVSTDTRAASSRVSARSATMPRNGFSCSASAVLGAGAARCQSGLRAIAISAMQPLSFEIIEPALADYREDGAVGQHDRHRLAHPLEPAIEQRQRDRMAERRAE